MISGYRLRLLAAALAIAACAPIDGVPVAHDVRIDPGYRPGDLSYVAGGKDLRTEIFGNPFAMSQTDFAAAVTAAMQGANFGPRLNFTTAPGESARSGYRLRLVFNGPATGGGALLCGDEPATVPPAREAGNIRLLAAFCRGDKPLTSLAADVGGVDDAGDPAFRRFMRQVTVLLFPPQNREDRDSRCTPPGDC